MDIEKYRLISFLIILIPLVIWESIKARREVKKLPRWRVLDNWGIFAIDIILIKILFPLGAAGIALVCEEKNIGLFHFFELGNSLKTVLSIIILDFFIYWQHRIFHTFHYLWVLHRVHHTDLILDTSSGFRFHPLEILLSLVIKGGLIIAFGFSVEGVLIFEIILNGMSLFTHANISLPTRLERVLRLVFITPEVHEVHHSDKGHETNSNFGFNLVFWDKLFGSFKGRAEDRFRYGVKGSQKNSLWEMIKLP